jgi:lysophospholipase L1-like esterase
MDGWDDYVTFPAPEPSATDPNPPVCGGGLPANAIVVDEQPTDLNLAGCPNPPAQWANQGTFSVQFGTSIPDGAPLGEIDFHQLGAGFGGHLWFTHTYQPGDLQDDVLGTWTPAPSVLTRGLYKIEVFVPDAAAGADQAPYTVYTGAGGSVTATLSQAAYGNEWVSIGDYALQPGASVQLDNRTADGDGVTDIAYNAVAFVPEGPGTYVSMGDSYSSGQGAGDYDPATNIATDSCHRSAHSFALQFAAGPPVAYPPGSIVNAACSGATITDLTTTGQYGEPAQVSQIPSTASLVTLAIGGNDAGFASVLARCVLLLSCEDYYTQNDSNNLDVTIDDLATPLKSLYEAVRAQAPGARVVVLTYPQILSPPDPVSGCAGELGMASSDISWLIEETNHLDDVIADAAAAAGVEVLDERDAFVGHEICSATPWVNGLQIFSDYSDSFHPNTAGYAQEAADLAAYLAQNPAVPAAAGTGAATVAAVSARAATAAATPAWTWQKPLAVPSKVQATSELTRLSRPGNVVTYMEQPGYYRADWTTHISRFSHTSCKVNYNVQQRDGSYVTLGPGNCAPDFGIWQDPYNGLTYGWDEIQVDHVVPQRNAYDMGAYLWADATGAFDRKRWLDFANDEYGLELLTVSNPSNNEKSDLPVDQWLPQGNPDFVCDYVKMWIDVKYHYNLTITSTERATLRQELTYCTS